MLYWGVMRAVVLIMALAGCTAAIPPPPETLPVFPVPVEVIQLYCIEDRCWDDYGVEYYLREVPLDDPWA